MSVEIPRQPTGAGQSCYKCGSYFVHTRGNPRGRQCGECRSKGKKAPSAVRCAAPRRPPSARKDGHTAAWEGRALGQAEAAALAQAWRQPQAAFVTGNCDAEQTA